MTKEKLISLEKYLGRMKDRLTMFIPQKWSHSPKTYKQFLQNEINQVSSKIEKAKLDVKA